MNVKEEVKFILIRRCVTLTELAKKMTEVLGKNYTQSLLSHKLAKESLKYSEMKVICKILNCKIKVEIDEDVTFTH